MIVLLALLAAAPQDKPSAASDAASRFSLDLPSVDAPAADPQPAPDQPAIAPPAAGATATAFSLDTPIADLIADPRARAVLDKDLPGLSTDENLDKFKAMTLRQLAPATGGQLTPELMTRTAYDLAAVTGGEPPKLPTARGRASGR